MTGFCLALVKFWKQCDLKLFFLLKHFQAQIDDHFEGSKTSATLRVTSACTSSKFVQTHWSVLTRVENVATNSWTFLMYFLQKLMENLAEMFPKTFDWFDSFFEWKSRCQTFLSETDNAWLSVYGHLKILWSMDIVKFAKNNSEALRLNTWARVRALVLCVVDLKNNISKLSREP